MSFESGKHMATSVRGSHPVPAPRQKRLSECLWDIDYDSAFPIVVSDDGITAELVGVEEALDFTREQYAALFGDPRESQFWSGDSPELRERYLRHSCDLFMFRDGPREVGLFIGNPVDWSTYYVRSVAFIDGYQGRSLGPTFEGALCAMLAERGVSRMEADAAPSNRQCVQALLRQGYVASGTNLSERWGALTHFTKHLQGEAQETFLRQFCAAGDIHQRQDHRRRLAASAIQHRKGVTQ